MEKTANRLINEKSPYLLQHAYNPVDWHPWGEEAFAKAKREDKPVFLSIGYSTCHWCHVMEHESFEDPAVAALMNEHFVNVKVDREERPDLDNVYMTACLMMNQRGGWPLTIIMTPDKKPFLAATYIPKQSRHQQAGMLDLIPYVSKFWKEQRDKLFETAETIVEHLRKLRPAAGGDPHTNTLATAYQQLADLYDPEYGGFGGGPKFPSPHQFLFLLRYHRRSGDPKVLEMVETTLTNMRLGGLFDQIGYGFHRYSTDAEWLLPHFEKMLYDQAMLAMAYTELYQVTGNAFYRDVTLEIFEYVLRDMTSPEGAFYSAEDADSEGEEGKFYVWSVAETIGVLGEEDAAYATKLWNFDGLGNFRDEATGKYTGTNIPHLSACHSDLAANAGVPFEEWMEQVERVRGRLFAEREKRIRPLLDDKILADWNGLMIAAMAKAAAAFDRPDLAEAAGKAADFALERMTGEAGRLMHRYRDGELTRESFLDDYAFMIWGLIELYQATFEAGRLRSAKTLANEAYTRFRDPQGGVGGGFHFAPNDAEELPTRTMDATDGAIPSGNSVMLLNLLRLSRLTGNADWEQEAAELFRAFSGNLLQGPANYCMMLCGTDFILGPSQEVVVAADDPQAEDAKAMLRALRDNFLPGAVIMLRHESTFELAPFTVGQPPLGDKATAYVCENMSCNAPTTDVEEMKKLAGVMEKASGKG